MGAESQMLQFAKEDPNLTRKRLDNQKSQIQILTKKIVKVGRSMDTNNNVMQQCLGILGNFPLVSQHYCQFHPNFVQHNPLQPLQNQGNYFNNDVNNNGQYREMGDINKA